MSDENRLKKLLKDPKATPNEIALETLKQVFYPTKVERAALEKRLSKKVNRE